MTCALCGEDRKLCKSHIIPELIFKPMYDDKHRFVQHSPKDGRVTYHQKGFREPLLCKPCETYLSKSENYVRGFLYGGQGYYSRVDGPFNFLSGLDYHHIRIFFLSVLWRMSISTLPVFKAVELGPHEEKLRRLLLADDPGSPEQYGFFAVAPYANGKFFGEFILEPDCIRFQNQKLYRAVIGGILYMFAVSNRPLAIPHPNFVIRESGEWIIQYRDIRRIKFLRQWLAQVNPDQGK